MTVEEMRFKAFIANAKVEIISEIVDKLNEMDDKTFESFKDSCHKSEGYSKIVFATACFAGEETSCIDKALSINEFCLGAPEFNISAKYLRFFETEDLRMRDLSKLTGISFDEKYDTFRGIFQEEDLQPILEALSKRCNGEENVFLRWNSTSSTWYFLIK